MQKDIKKMAEFWKKIVVEKQTSVKKIVEKENKTINEIPNTNMYKLRILSLQNSGILL